MRLAPPHRAQVKPGDRFTHLTVIGVPFYIKKGRQSAVCECECGEVRLIFVECLLSGNTMSCGCHHRRRAAEGQLKHGGRHTRLYCIWKGMMKRCHGKSSKNNRYRYHGQRGVSVCPEWRESFSAFRDWALSNGYADNLSIDRKDGDSDYMPGNCRWATVTEQNRNQRIRVTNKSGYRGVFYERGRWLACICVNKKKLYLARCQTPEEAARVYNEAALRFHGQFASLNEIPGEPAPQFTVI